MTLNTLARRASTDHDEATKLLERRRSVSAGRLAAPGPDARQLQRLLGIAARVPDHGALVPWRFITIEGDARGKLAKRLGAACVDAAGDDTDARLQAQKTVEKLDRLFGHPPVIVIVVGRPSASATIPVQEQVLSAGAVCMNLMTGAAAMGFATNWLTGWIAAHPAARAVLGLAEDETVAGIIPIGTPMDTPPDRPRPDLSKIVEAWVG